MSWLIGRRLCPECGAEWDDDGDPLCPYCSWPFTLKLNEPAFLERC